MQSSPTTHVDRIICWYRSEFSVVWDDAVEESSVLSTKKLLRAIYKRKGMIILHAIYMIVHEILLLSSHLFTSFCGMPLHTMCVLLQPLGNLGTLTFLLAILLRSLAICEDVRFVQCIDIPPPLPYYFEDIVISCEESIQEEKEVRSKYDCRVKTTPQRSEGAMKIQLLMPIDTQTGKRDRDTVTYVDCEETPSSSSSQQRADSVWLTIGVTDTDMEHGTNAKLVPVQYVVAIDGSGSVADVTNTYVTNRKATRANRLTHDDDIHWLREHINDENSISMTNSSSNDHKIPITLDRKRMKMEPMPKSISGFMKSECYILESQIGKLSILRPVNDETGKKNTFVALFNGEKVYCRKDISKLESSGGWRKLGREVKEDEIPISTIKRKRGHETYESNLYGDWQTLPIKILEVIDGILPSNEHGNIEVWNGNERLVPVGAALLKSTKPMTVFKIATELGIQYRRALFGFEDRQGIRCPVFGGIVVMEKDKDVVRAAVDQIEYDEELRRENIREGKILRRWQILVSKVLTRLSLKERYNA